MDEATKHKIESMIKSEKVFLFMKGTPEYPECGFSMRVVQILKSLNVKFGSYNILEDETMRNSIKEYSNWPTIPQLYINEKFIGGCDITEAMYNSGELQELLK
ncbi:Grx4 family monothiol glutaredoxin [Candidatus Woesearchaeota archaeon]|nr:MAG: monothiol glutaredoxin [archaeon GW2011_AR18]MBS3161371.1 Grx4 family monothiol glutaredoxin [Candidatus Woesearchaeota archaeon]HIH25403.1 Grx4 family monothiol glutaredoxin [Nanoarchaeota archaeon]